MGATLNKTHLSQFEDDDSDDDGSYYDEWATFDSSVVAV